MQIPKIRTVINIGLLVTLLLLCHRVVADGKRKKEQVDPNSWNPYACCHKMDQIEKVPAMLVERYAVPEFFQYDTLHRGDTSYVYHCYDRGNRVVNMDTIHDFACIGYISLLKYFVDPGHTYKDSMGNERLLPLSRIVKRYDRTTPDKWIAIAYPGNKFSNLKEYRNIIVRTDSFSEEDRSSNTIIMSVYKYYKVATVQ
jgi:hypothetical protein